jgi:hypothetical protein
MLLIPVLTTLLAFGIPISGLPASQPDLNERRESINEKPNSINERDNFSVTRNELSGPCKPVTIIFARGTTEFGNVGTFAGPPFFNAVGNRLGDSNVAVQGVDYPASIPGYLQGGDPKGATKMFALINQAATQCPSTQIVLSGYR